MCLRLWRGRLVYNKVGECSSNGIAMVYFGGAAEDDALGAYMESAKDMPGDALVGHHQGRAGVCWLQVDKGNASIRRPGKVTGLRTQCALGQLDQQGCVLKHF